MVTNRRLARKPVAVLAARPATGHRKLERENDGKDEDRTGNDFCHGGRRHPQGHPRRLGQGPPRSTAEREAGRNYDSRPLLPSQPDYFDGSLVHWTGDNNLCNAVLGHVDRCCDLTAKRGSLVCDGTPACHGVGSHGHEHEELAILANLSGNGLPFGRADSYHSRYVLAILARSTSRNFKSTG